MSQQPSESPLAGGYLNHVVRVGSTVRRPVPRRAAFVRRLLHHLELRQWPGAPRYRGIDEQGREILTYLDGEVPWQNGGPRCHAALAEVARLVRLFHDLTAGTELAGDAEVVCHNDLSPKNTVYRRHGERLHPVAFIDWDLAAPGDRIHDVAHVCWQYTGLGLDPPASTGRRIRVIADAYGMADRSTLIDAILWWQDRCWRGIEAGAAAADPAMVRLRDHGAARRVREQYGWTAAHRRVLTQALA